jgi:hypothetical protein
MSGEARNAKQMMCWLLVLDFKDNVRFMMYDFRFTISALTSSIANPNSSIPLR